MLFKDTVFIGIDPPSGEKSLTYAALDKELNLIAMSTHYPKHLDMKYWYTYFCY